MILKKAIGTIVIVLLQLNIAFAQNSFEIGGVYSLTAEKLLTNSDAISNHMHNQFNHSFGINGKKVFKSNVFVQGGLHLKEFGTKVNLESIIIDDLANEMGGKSIDIPINVGYYLFKNNKIRLGMSLGVNNGFLLSQYQNYYGVIREDIPVYKDYMFQLNSSIEIGIRLTDNIILDVRPVFQRQINSNYGSYKQRGIGCQFGISYDFTGN